MTFKIKVELATVNGHPCDSRQTHVVSVPKSTPMSDLYASIGAALHEKYKLSGECTVRKVTLVHEQATIVELSHNRKPSPTVVGNVRCMDCHCGGFDCKGMPKGYEQLLMDNG